MRYGLTGHWTDEVSYTIACPQLYTAIEVACGWGRGSDEKANPSYWAGVVMQKPLLNAKKADGDGQKEGKTDGWPNRWTDAWTEWADGETEKWNNRQSGL